MIIFSLGLILLLLIALSFFVVPLLFVRRKIPVTAQAQINRAIYQEQALNLENDYQNKLISKAEYQALRDEMSASLLHDVIPAQAGIEAQGKFKNNSVFMYVICVLFVLIAIGAYFLWGNPGSVEQQLQQQKTNQAAQAMLAELKTPQQVIAKLQAAVQTNPNDPQGWFLLGRLYMGMQEYNQAQAAFAKANALKPNDVDIMLNYAQVLFVVNHNHLNTQAKQLLQAIITQDPDNPGVLNLLALDAYTRGDYQAAIHYWQTILVNLPSDTSAAQAVQNAINNAKAKMSQGEAGS